MAHFSVHIIVSKINCCFDSIMLLLAFMESVGLPLQLALVLYLLSKTFTLKRSLLAEPSCSD